MDNKMLWAQLHAASERGNVSCRVSWELFATFARLTPDRDSARPWPVEDDDEEPSEAQIVEPSNPESRTESG